MKFNLYRCSSGYVLTPDTVPEPKSARDVGPLDYIGHLTGDTLRQAVYRRVVDEVADRGYAVISKAELGLP